MSNKSSESLSFLDQVMEICDRILDQKIGAGNEVHHDREDVSRPAVDSATE